VYLITGHNAANIRKLLEIGFLVKEKKYNHE
jgi:hypothetical protein